MEREQLPRQRLVNAMKEGRFKTALLQLDQLQHAESLPENREWLVTRAELLDRTGRTREATRALRSLERSKDLPGCLQIRCELVKGRVSKRLGHLEDAAAAFKKALRQAEESGNVELHCWAQLRLMKLLTELEGPDAADRFRTDLQRQIVHVGSVEVAHAYDSISLSSVQDADGQRRGTGHRLTIPSKE